MKNILVVDDEENIRNIIKKYAEFEGYKVYEAPDGAEALKILREENIDIVIMDVLMPYIDGLTALKEIRKTMSVPVIILSAKSEEYDKIHGYDLGGDDYIEKPFSPKILLRKIEAILKRVQNINTNIEQCYQFKNLRIDYGSRKVTIENENIPLSLKEYDLLTFLVKNKNIALERGKIMDTVWGYDFYGDERTLDAHIKTLRKSLKEYGQNIVTIRGVGYRFEDE